MGILLVLVVVLAGPAWLWYRNDPARKVPRLLNELSKVPGDTFDLFYFGRDTDAILADFMAMGEKAVPPLIDALHHPNSGIRRRAVFVLEHLGDRRAVGPLIERLQDSNRTVRRFAADALGALGDRSAVDPLISSLGDREGGVQRAAARALGKLGDRRAVDPLLRLLPKIDLEEEATLAMDVVLALGTLGDRKAIEPIRQAGAKAQTSVVGDAVIRALHQLGAPPPGGK
jgi:HEAT repeat protein